ncbi:MAG: thymidine phosphorylase [Anaerovoracaceae bacterium]
MNMVQIIAKKRDGNFLSKEEIAYVIKNYINGKIPDYQVSALLMAIYYMGLNDQEVFYLTEEMKNSGEVINLSMIDGTKVDKHSTGGVGDKTTLIVAPIAAAAGVKIAKMSGRGLGFTGGTIDKLESIPGFNVTLTPEEFVSQVQNIGISVIGQSANIAAADKLLYSLRDVTATVDSKGLIASSIMSKKLASGSDAIVLDVKYGSGAFMKEKDEALNLAEIMTKIGKAAGKNTVAVITNMDEPLGYNIGNSNEVIEAIEVLKGNGNKDLTKLSIVLASIMILISGKVESLEEGENVAREMIKTKKALCKLKEMIKSQGGNVDVIDDYSLFESAKYEYKVYGPKGKYVKHINSKLIGAASQLLGAGRSYKEEKIDMAAGVVLAKKVNDYIDCDEDTLIATLYSNKSREEIEDAINMIEEAYVFDESKTQKPDIIYKIVGLK